MKVYEEKELRYFEFWSGAKDTVKYLTFQELDRLEEMLETMQSEWNETELNDFFWFKDDLIAQMLGYSDFEEIMNERKENLR